MSAREIKGTRLVTASEVAQIAGVQRSAVSNWRKRYPDFPAPAGTAPSGGDLFVLDQIERWLEAHKPIGRGTRPEALEQLWAVAERLRGQSLHGDLIGAVASGAALVHLTRSNRSELPARNQLATLEWATKHIRMLREQEPTLAELFTPLLSIDPSALVLLLDTLSEFETPEQLREALDFVLERATRYSDFRTDESIAALLARIAEPTGTTYDPAAGAAELLIRANEVGDEDLALYGQELNQSTWRVALARLLLRNIRATIELGDSLTDDHFPDLQASVILCEPPAGVRAPDLRGLRGDPRWKLLGTLDTPPARASDFIWLAHVISHLSESGRGYVLLAAGSLFRGGSDARLRSELIRQGTVEAIVSLPRSSSSSATAAPLALWMVRRPVTSPDPVLLIDAADARALGQQLQDRVTATIRRWRRQPDSFQPVPGFATTVPVLELLAGDASLVPSRWLFEPELVDTDRLVANIAVAERALRAAHAAAVTDIPAIRVDPTPAPSPTIRVRDLLELGEAELVRPVRLKTDVFGTEGLPVWLPADIKEPWRIPEPSHYLAPMLADPNSLTQPGDIVFTTVGGLRTHVDDFGGHILGTSLHALRLVSDAWDPHAVGALLTSERNRRLFTGATIPRVNILEFELPRLDLDAARHLGTIFRALDREQEALHAFAASANVLRQTLVDAIATGAVTVDSKHGNELPER